MKAHFIYSLRVRCEPWTCSCHLRAHGTFTTFSPICFFNLLDMKSSPVRHLTAHGKILGSNPIEVLYYVMLHIYLQQPGIIKMFLLCNIHGKVPLFFLYKQDIMRVNCMQNITKYYILLSLTCYFCISLSLCYCTRSSAFQEQSILLYYEQLA